MSSPGFLIVARHQTLNARLTELDTGIQVQQEKQQSLTAQLEEQRQRLQKIDERVRTRKEELHQELAPTARYALDGDQTFRRAAPLVPNSCSAASLYRTGSLKLGLSEQFRATAQNRLERAQAAATRIQQELIEAEKRQRDGQSEHDGLLARLAVQNQQQADLAAQLAELEGQLAQFLTQANLVDEQALRALLLTPEEARQFRERVEQHGQQLHTARQRQQDLETRLGDRRPSPADLTEAQEAEKQLRVSQNESSQHHGALEEQIRQLQHDLEQQAGVRKEMEAVTHKLKLHKKLGHMLTASGLKAFVANRLLHEILRLASAELERLSGRYQLELAPEGDILVVDNWNAGETRDVRSLSGGETFLASLSLALAMVEYLSQGSPLESLFIDEGFGTLDPETLEAVTLTLESLHEKGRLVGVITHVQKLAERLPMQVRVEKGQGISHLATD